MEWDREKLTRFFRTGIIVLSVMVVISSVLRFAPKAVETISSIGKKELPIYFVETDKKQVALSFDATSGKEDTNKILSILQKYDVKVSFFMTGDWIVTYPDEVKAIAAAGHDIGNYSESYEKMTTLTKEESIEEIKALHQKVKDLTGVEMSLFRAPYNEYNTTLLEAVKDCGYSCIQWNVDSSDWKDYGANHIVKTVLKHKQLGNGSIILCHNGAKYMADALEIMILGLKEKGYEIVPISQLIYDQDNERKDKSR